MSYEMAKSLRDAGYPQVWLTGYPFDCHQFWKHDERAPENHMYLEFVKQDDFYHDGHAEYPEVTAQQRKIQCIQPTLSELIEACGDHFDCLANCGTYWRASHFVGISAEGTTPEEAVGKLWLALNKKT